jgi:hypothetical protein
MIDVKNRIFDVMKNKIFSDSQYENNAARIVLAELKTKLIDFRTDITSEIQYKILKKMKGDRETSIEIYTDANRMDLRKKESIELLVIDKLIIEIEADLPKQMSEEEIENKIKKFISENSNSNIGMIMKEFKDIKNVDKKLVSTIAKKLLM